MLEVLQSMQDENLRLLDEVDRLRSTVAVYEKNCNSNDSKDTDFLCEIEKLKYELSIAKESLKKVEFEKKTMSIQFSNKITVIF